MRYSKKHLSSLYTWYQKNGRHSLPWRNTMDPYAIYVSEIMLQQTQVQTVLNRYYHPFLKKFPSLTALANASLEDVLNQWQGLGYYNRAKNLHASATLCAPKLPDSIEELHALPGIGKNTAHAIAAFAYHQPVPIMEANIKRILHRVFALENATQSQLWSLAGSLLDTENPFDYNQAMMDIGAMICTPRTPNCLECPLRAICKGHSSPERYPRPKAKSPLPVRRKKIVVLITNQQELHLFKRDSLFLHGMYGFPEMDAHDNVITIGAGQYDVTGASPIGAISQTYSHFQLQADIYLLPAKEEKSEVLEFRAMNTLKKFPLSEADKKILSLVRQHCGE